MLKLLTVLKSSGALYNNSERYLEGLIINSTAASIKFTFVFHGELFRVGAAPSYWNHHVFFVQTVIVMEVIVVATVTTVGGVAAFLKCVQSKVTQFNDPS